ncbi:MAG: hypothetical protein AAB288_08270, partial [Acidobacteriota bacterium]
MFITSAIRFAVIAVIASAMAVLGNAQVTRTFSVSAGARIEVVNRTGRVEVTVNETSDPGSSSAPTQGTVAMSAASASSISQSDIKVSSSSSLVRVEVVSTDTRKRIDISLNVPAKMRLKIETGEGEVRVSGDVLSADVLTGTGTISAMVPTAHVRYMLRWTASRPRFLSDFELEKARERSAGKFEISGTYRDESGA